jgi:hypothetical protein
MTFSTHAVTIAACKKILAFVFDVSSAAVIRTIILI